MHRNNRLAFLNISQFFLDVSFVLLSYIVSYNIVHRYVELYDINRYTWIIIVFLPLWILMMTVLGMYNKTTFTYYDRILRYILHSTLISFIFLAALMYFIKETMFSRTFFGVFLITTIIFTTLERFIYVALLKKFRGLNATNVIVIGIPELFEKFKYYLTKTNINMNIIGYVRVNSNEKIDEHIVLGDIDNLKYILSKYVVDEVVFALPKDYVGDVEEYVLMCEEMGITVRMLLDLFDLKVAKTHITAFGTMPMITFHTVTLNHFQLFAKRVIDIIGALVGLTITAVIGTFVAVLIKMESPGPAIFAQNRVGMNGRIFKCYKFRSMCVDAEARKVELAALNQVGGGLMFKVKDDPRITRVGSFIRKTSIDELPQFFNVLKGDMSLVGTRPPTMDEVGKYKTNHRRRISMKPGITGMWQVSGRSSITDFDEVVRLDTEYIDNWSIWLDLKIIIKTILVVFKRKGAL